MDLDLDTVDVRSITKTELFQSKDRPHSSIILRVVGHIMTYQISKLHKVIGINYTTSKSTKVDSE